MRLLFVADGRSPIALNWINYFVKTGHEVHLASTYPCSPMLGLASMTVIPAAFGDLAGDLTTGSGGKATGFRGILRRLAPVEARTAVRQWLGAWTLPGAAQRLRALTDRLQPDLVHAMRIPYEGMLAASALGNNKIRLVISVWGNDFTLHARANPWMTVLTRRALNRADGLHTDCRRDHHLAQTWGFDNSKPAVVLPGNGGIDMSLFHPPQAQVSTQEAMNAAPVVINPRGMRSYVRNDTFFRAIPQVLARQPNARFICPAMAGEALAERWIHELGVAHAVTLLPHQPRPAMADLFRRAQVAVSLTEHDGTPNTLLEAMACGCYPVAGDIEALREWITPGVNGAMVAPDNPAAAAAAILQALNAPAKRQAAADHNLRLIAERAEYGACMRQAENFYQKLG